MIKKMDHVVFTTKDLTKTFAFYKVLGFETKSGEGRYEMYAGDFKINVHILNKELLPHAMHVKTGSLDICFEISGNIQLYKKQLEDEGLIIEMGIVHRNGTKGQMNSLYLRDPDGNLVEICSYE